MARFRATIQGNRGEASRLGTVKSGMAVTINGWEGGVHVIASVKDGEDVFAIYATSGSLNRKLARYVASVRGGEFVPVSKELVWNQQS